MTVIDRMRLGRMKTLTRKCVAALDAGDHVGLIRYMQERDRLYVALAPHAALAYIKRAKGRT